MGTFEIKILVTQSVEAETAEEAERQAFENIGREFDTQHLQTACLQGELHVVAQSKSHEQSSSSVQSPRAVDLAL